MTQTTAVTMFNTAECKRLLSKTPQEPRTIHLTTMEAILQSRTLLVNRNHRIMVVKNHLTQIQPTLNESQGIIRMIMRRVAVVLSQNSVTLILRSRLNVVLFACHRVRLSLLHNGLETQRAKGCLQETISPQVAMHIVVTLVDRRISQVLNFQKVNWSLITMRVQNLKEYL